MKAPLIFEIKGNSLDDGAGIRSVVFFKGCPLACIWCHNPEGMRTGVEIAFDQRECIGCNTCIETCLQHALARDNPFFIDRQRCTLCFLCTEACPSGALDRVGREMTKEAILEKVLKDKPFYDTSGGGVTLSGGEPTLYMDSVSALLQALKTHGIHCLLETCGQFDLERFTALVYPYLDAIYYDIKLFDPEEHKRFCGVTNATILANFVELVERTRADGKEFLPRVPLVPNITDSDANLGAIAAFLQSHQVTKAKLLPYNPLWPEKSSKVGIGTDSLDASMKKWMASEKIKHCESIFRDHDLDV
jgi:pyruvate formate lyase activating enzyme